MKRRRATSWALALLLFWAGSGAWAYERPPRQVGLSARRGWLGVHVSLRDLFWPEDIEKVRSGFVNRVVIRVELYRGEERQPIARADRSSDILYDLWDEAFRVKTVDRRGPQPESTVSSPWQAIELATALRGFPVTDLGRLSPGAVYRFRFRADLNPLSEDLVADVRRWVVQRPGQAPSGAGEGFFGSFVRIFVNPRIEESDRSLTFWSQPFRKEDL